VLALLLKSLEHTPFETPGRGFKVTFTFE